MNRYGDKEGDGLRRRLYVSYCPRKTSRSTQHPSGFPASVGDRDGISGLTRSFYTRSQEQIIVFSLLSNDLLIFDRSLRVDACPIN